MTVRHIGLSLGADLCWPIFYEDIVAKLAPRVDLGEETVHVRSVDFLGDPACGEFSQ